PLGERVPSGYSTERVHEPALVSNPSRGTCALGLMIKKIEVVNDSRLKPLSGNVCPRAVGAAPVEVLRP
ncbi:MAG: hypothetical protein N3C12_10275, partial [Candidatus Binatia bacterium]|nr:hypothetical protein [Candidatus Binatia bacterium]